MVQDAVLPQQHSQNAHPVLAGAEHVAKQGKGRVVVARHLRVHHLEYRALRGACADLVDILRGNLLTLAKIGAQLVHLLAQQRRVTPYGKDQPGGILAAEPLAHAAQRAYAPVGAFGVVHGGEIHDGILLFEQRVELLAAVGLALDVEHHARRRRNAGHVVHQGGGPVLVLGLAARGEQGAFPHHHHALLGQKRQRLGSGDERVGSRVGQIRQVHLLQPFGQKTRAQVFERLLLDVFLRALKQVAAGDAPGLEGLEKGGVIHGAHLTL